jgi:hypothetical protein
MRANRYHIPGSAMSPRLSSNPHPFPPLPLPSRDSMSRFHSQSPSVLATLILHAGDAGPRSHHHISDVKPLDTLINWQSAQNRPHN